MAFLRELHGNVAFIRELHVKVVFFRELNGNVAFLSLYELVYIAWTNIIAQSMYQREHMFCHQNDL